MDDARVNAIMAGAKAATAMDAEAARMVLAREAREGGVIAALAREHGWHGYEDAFTSAFRNELGGRLTEYPITRK